MNISISQLWMHLHLESFIQITATPGLFIHRQRASFILVQRWKK